MHTISLLPDRLPKNQECHEMWSRKKRKKEAAAAAATGGGAKEGAGSSNGSAAATSTSTTVNAKLTLSDLSRSRSQSGSPVKEPLHQQRSGSVGPTRNSGGGGEGSSLSLSQLANGSLQPASKPRGGGGGGEPPPQHSQQHQLHNIPPPAHGTAVPPAAATGGVVVIPPPSSSGPPGSNLKQYPLNQNHPPSLIPPTGVGGGAGGAVLPPQLHPHAPVVNPPSLHPPRGGEAPPIIQTQQLGAAVPAPPTAGGGEVGEIEGIQVKQAHKTLANPNIKPSLTVPLPTVPLSASILESLHDVASKVDTAGTTASSSNNSASNSGNGNSNAGGANIGPAISTAGAELKDSTNAMGAHGSTDGVGGPPGVGVMVTSSSSAAASQQQIQQVIDAQRTQLALLSQQITQLVTEQNLRTNPLQDNDGSGGMMRGHISSMAPGLGGYPPKTSSITSRTQTFDYGNRSNKVLENAAVHQLEQDYYRGDQSGRNY